MFKVWVKSRQGIRLVGNRWENVYSWSVSTVHDTQAEADEKASKLTPTSESPVIAVRHESEPMY